MQYFEMLFFKLIEALLYFLDSILVTKHKKRGKHWYLKHSNNHVLTPSRRSVCSSEDGFTDVMTMVLLI